MARSRSALGEAWTARDVGAAMGRNPIPIIIPCHRVVAANGKLGGFSAPGGNETKRRMLAIEQAAPKGACRSVQRGPIAQNRASA